jgi:hypothetical protein
MCVAEALKGHSHAFADAPSRIRSTLSKRFEDTAIPLREKSPQPHRTANGQKLALSVGRESLSVKRQKVLKLGLSSFIGNHADQL